MNYLPDPKALSRASLTRSVTKATKDRFEELQALAEDRGIPAREFGNSHARAGNAAMAAELETEDEAETEPKF